MPIAEIQAPDGRILEIEVPEGATEEQILSFVSANYTPDETMLTPVARLSPTDIASALTDPRAAQAVGAGFAGLGAGLSDLPEGVVQTSAEIVGAEQLASDIAERQKQKAERAEQDEFFKVGRMGGQLAPAAAVPVALPQSFVGKLAVAGGLGGLLSATEPVEKIQTPLESLENRSLKFLTGGLTASAVPVLGKGAQIAGKGLGVAKNAILGRPAEEILSTRLDVDNLTSIRKVLADPKRQTVLADLGGDEVHGLLRAVARKPGGSRRVVNDFLEKRNMASFDRITKNLQDNVSSVDTYFGRIDEMAKLRSKLSAPLYAQAYTQGSNIQNKELDRLLVDKRVQKAIKGAIEDFGIDKNAKLNSLEVLDGAKKKLDDVINTATRTGEAEKAKAFKELKNKLVSVLDNEVPTYGQARKAYAGFASLENAQKRGSSVFKLSPEEIRMQVGKLNPSEKDAFLIGVRNRLQEDMSRTAVTGSPAKRIYGTPRKQSQVKAAFGDNKEGFKDFNARMLQELKMADTRNAVLGGSRTDFNLDEVGDLIEESVRTGGDVKGQVLTNMASWLKNRYVGLDNKAAKELTEILLNKGRGLELVDDILARQDAVGKAAVYKFMEDVPIMLGIATATEVTQED